MFKVGDRVKVVNLDKFDSISEKLFKSFIGKNGVIREVFLDRPILTFDNKEINEINEDYGEICFYQHNLELIPQKSAQDMAKEFVGKTELELVEYFAILGYEKAKKDPYKEFCTAEEILDSGIKLEKEMKVLIKEEIEDVGEIKRYFANIDTEFIYCYNDGATEWINPKQTAWNYAKFVK